MNPRPPLTSPSVGRGGYTNERCRHCGRIGSERRIAEPINSLLTLLQQVLEQYLTSATPPARGHLPSTPDDCTGAVAGSRDVGMLVERLLTAKQADGLSDRYIQTLRSHLRRFAAAMDCDIASVSVSEMEEWLRRLAIGARARNNIRSSIITLFHFARKEGYLLKGEPTEADEIARAKDRGGKIGIFRPEEFTSLVEQAPQKAQVFLAIGAFAGLRSSEILRLDWSEINLDRRVIIVAPEKAKTATRRLVPIQPNLKQWLQPCRATSGCLFRTRREIDGAIGFVKDSGVEWPNNALRHSYATYRLALTADAARVALEMGNSPRKLMRHYRELATEYEAAAWFAICPTNDSLIAECHRLAPNTTGLNSSGNGCLNNGSTVAPL